MERGGGVSFMLKVSCNLSTFVPKGDCGLDGFCVVKSF